MQPRDRFTGSTAQASIHFLLYLCVGGVCFLTNMLLFLGLSPVLPVLVAAVVSFGLATLLNYWLCTRFLFQARQNCGVTTRLVLYVAVVLAGGGVDIGLTVGLVGSGLAPWAAKCTGSAAALAVNYFGRRLVVFEGVATFLRVSAGSRASTSPAP